MQPTDAKTRDPQPLTAAVEAADHLHHLGFLLVSPFPPGAESSELSIAIRERPTLQHFDPEVIRFWHTGSDRRGHPEQLDLASQVPVAGRYAWGKIEVVDRFGVENAFVSLGGDVQADLVDDDLLVAVFRSIAPILRMGGHSQASDLVALELAAFFGRMMVPVDFDPGAEQALAAADPLAHYSAFVAFERDRYLGHLLLRQEHPLQAEVLAEEAERLRRDHPDAWEGGRRLLDRLRLRS